MDKDKFFTNPKIWSRRKHRLLGKYLPPFSAKVGSWAKLIHCIDGFAGAAKYEDGSSGSPLMMAQLADKCASWRRPVNLRLINVENNPDNYKSLTYITQGWESKGIVTNLEGQFGNLVLTILSAISNDPAFFFIDPYGPTYVHFSHLLPILKREQRATELIINFDADGLRRIADTMHSRSSTKQAVKASLTNIENVTEIIGSDQWKELYEKGNLPTYQREKILLQIYMENIAKHDYTVTAYPIRKSIKDTPKYFLVYCTRHPDGVVLMSNFIREEEDTLLEESTVNVHQPKFPSEEFDELRQEIIGRRKQLTALVIEYLRECALSTRGQIRTYFSFQRFGDFSDKDYNSVVKDLIDANRLLPRHGKKRINDDEPLTFVG
ncbi:MAG TPA: three-Cys-motif partner protein TcmP [Pyrinomonadaceae bacterium]|nr:three-Cys-motif partner protein TcmP [Pyrinomonadaceae bacterium]